MHIHTNHFSDNYSSNFSRNYNNSYSHSAKLTTSLLSIIVLGLMLVGCGSEPNQSDGLTDDTPQSSVEAFNTIQGTIQIGTDLEIAKLQDIADTYSEETGVNIEWQPVTEADIKSWLDLESVQDIEPNLNSDAKLPKDLDMLLMHSAYTLSALGQTHQLQPVASQILLESIPEQYQDPNGEWYGLTTYARTLVYNKNNVNEPELTNYASVAADKWINRLCMTSIDTADNQAILKVMLPYRGQKQTPKVLRGWLNNMNSPLADDHSILTQIEQGGCDVGIVNSDIFWQYIKDNPDTHIRLTWANQINRGTITNAITAGITTSGDDAGKALEFIEWLASDTGQALLAFNTSTFPIIDIKDPLINKQAIRPDWTQFDADPTSLSDIILNDSQIDLVEPETAIEE